MLQLKLEVALEIDIDDDVHPEAVKDSVETILPYVPLRPGMKIKSASIRDAEFAGEEEVPVGDND